MGSSGKGGSQSRFFRCDDDEQYLVKFTGLQGVKTVINELVGILLALEIRLPAPEVILVDVHQEVIDTLPSEFKANQNVKNGIHIGIRRIMPDAWDLDSITPEMTMGRILINRDELSGVISFDNWVLNTDRQQNPNNMLQLLPDNKMKYIMIDFGLCFNGDNWGGDLQQSTQQLALMATSDFLMKNITDINEFEKWFLAIENFNTDIIGSIVDAVPQTWNMSATDNQALKAFIQTRRNLVRQIINDNRGQLNLGN